ncbi:MAG: hypothetical protein PVI40_05960 [Chlamydiota bacterium]|jgi:hypothetical protein
MPNVITGREFQDSIHFTPLGSNFVGEGFKSIKEFNQAKEQTPALEKEILELEDAINKFELKKDEEDVSRSFRNNIIEKAQSENRLDSEYYNSLLAYREGLKEFLSNLKKAEKVSQRIQFIYNKASWVQGGKFGLTLAACIPVTIISLPLRLIPSQIHKKASEPPRSFFTRAVSSVVATSEDWSIIGVKHSFVTIKFLRTSARCVDTATTYNDRYGSNPSFKYTAKNALKKTGKRMLGFNSGQRSSIAERIQNKKYFLRNMGS